MKPTVNKYFLALSLAATGLTTSPAQAANLVQYDFTAQSFASTLSDAHVTAGNVNFTGSTAASTSIFGANVLGVSVDETKSTNYFQFQVAPTSGYELNLTSLDFKASAAIYGSGAAIRSSVDSFASNLGSVVFSTGYPNFNSYSVGLTGAAFQGLTSATTFRVYTVNGSEESAAYDNLSLSGSALSLAAAPVPEPETYAMLLAGLGVLGFAKRRKQRAA